MSTPRPSPFALVIFTVLVAGVAHASPTLSLGSALLAADTDEKASDEEGASSEPAASEAAAAPAADAAPTTTEPAAPEAEMNKMILPTAKGAILGAIVGGILVGGTAFVILPMFTPELEPFGIGGGEAYMVSIWSLAIGVPVGALLGAAAGAGVGYGLAMLEE